MRWNNKMPRVIDDINEHIEDKFYIDDIEEVYAIQFENAYSPEDVLRIISNLNRETPGIIKTAVSLKDERINGTYAYSIKLLRDKEVNIPIW